MSGSLGVTYITKEDRVKGNTLRKEGIFLEGAPSLSLPFFGRDRPGDPSQARDRFLEGARKSRFRLRAARNDILRLRPCRFPG